MVNESTESSKNWVKVLSFNKPHVDSNVFSGSMPENKEKGIDGRMMMRQENVFKNQTVAHFLKMYNLAPPFPNKTEEKIVQ